MKLNSKKRSTSQPKKTGSSPLDRFRNHPIASNTGNKYFKKLNYENPKQSIDAENTVKQQYAIQSHAIKSSRFNKDRSLSQSKNRYKNIYDRYITKLETDAEQHSIQLKQKRSSSSKLSTGNSKSLSRKSQPNRRQTVLTVKKKPNLNYISSEKYIRINLEQFQAKKKQYYEAKIRNLQQQVQEYKGKYENSLKTIHKMNKYILSEKNKQQNEKQVYEEKINTLKAQLQSKTSNNYIPHLFTYKEYESHKLIPESMILQNIGQSKTSQATQKKNPEDISYLQNAMQEFLAKPSSKSSSGVKSNLSLESK